MAGFTEDSEQAQAYQNYKRESSKRLSHELVGKAAAYQANLALNEHVKHRGLPDSPQKAQQMMTKIASAFVDSEVEVKGLTSVDKQRAKRQAQQDINQLTAMDFGYIAADQSNRTTM